MIKFLRLLSKTLTSLTSLDIIRNKISTIYATNASNTYKHDCLIFE